jgi:Na+/H+-dicarboxylate symporter
MSRSRSWIVVLALIAGLAAGAWIEAAGSPAIREGASYVKAIGDLWLNALRMTVAPLIFALLVTGVASVADAMATGRLAARAVLLFTLLLFFAGVYAVAAAYGLNALWPLEHDAAQAFLAGAAQGGAEPVQVGGFSQWLLSLVPTNAVRAAADDATLPLVVFALLFGFAATRIPQAQREVLTNLFAAIAETMVVIVHWVLLVAPIGVFALALGVGASAGAGAAGVLFHYVCYVSLAIIGVTLIAYLLAALWGRTPLARFAVAIAPAQVVAVSTQSSLATLPAMLEIARGDLRISRRVADLILPLAVAVFRFTSPVGNLAVCFFIAALYGFHPSALQIASAIFVAYAVSIGSVGLPGQVSFIASIAPICVALGLPLDLLGIFLAVEVMPDIFRTLGNVTGDLAVTAMLRGEEESNSN